MKVTLKGVNTSNLTVPLEDIEGAIPVLAEMINDLRNEMNVEDDTWTKRLRKFLRRKI